MAGSIVRWRIAVVVLIIAIIHVRVMRPPFRNPAMLQSHMPEGQDSL